MKYKFLEHTADIKFRAFGKNLEEVFENSAYALTKVICDDKIKGGKILKIKVKGKDFENLLYEFLEEILFLFETKNFLLSKIKKIKIDKNKNLTAEFSGDDSENYQLHAHVKAATYNEMFVKKIGKKFVSQVVVDV